MRLLLESTLRLHGEFGGHFVRQAGGGGGVVGDGEDALFGIVVSCRVRLAGGAGDLSNFLVVVRVVCESCMVESVRWGWCRM